MYIGVGEIGDSCVVTLYERLKIRRTLCVRLLFIRHVVICQCIGEQ